MPELFTIQLQKLGNKFFVVSRRFVVSGFVYSLNN